MKVVYRSKILVCITSCCVFPGTACHDSLVWVWEFSTIKRQELGPTTTITTTIQSFHRFRCVIFFSSSLIVTLINPTHFALKSFYYGSPLLFYVIFLPLLLLILLRVPSPHLKEESNEGGSGHSRSQGQADRVNRPGMQHQHLPLIWATPLCCSHACCPPPTGRSVGSAGVHLRGCQPCRERGRGRRYWRVCV